ncbi:MAG: ABC transporter permease [Candidatus Peribacteraceae bacterium]|nr:ABC transporter permease [Candidatus Peribacteraceae bacterium]
MLLSDTLSTATRGLTRNLMRSLLTTLGIIIGVGSVVLMVSIGSSFQAFILEQVESFSGDIFEVHPKGLETFGGAIDTISNDDFDAIRRLSTVTSAAPVVFVRQRITYGRESVSPMIFATTETIFSNFSLKVAQGRLLDESDVKGAKTVAVIGSKAAEDLFGDDDPLGKRITIGTAKVTVVGVLESLGSLVGQQMDAYVYLPITLGRMIAGNSSVVNYISLKSAGNVELTKLDIETLLRQRHDIDNPANDPDKDDFVVRSFEQATEMIGVVTLSITLFLGLLAGISLLVGGIGIMNIMLVSVTERTKEIGLRKALGARQRDILLQFLVESVLLTVAGGLIGVTGAVTGGYLLVTLAGRFLEGFSYSLPPSAVLLAVGMAAGVGLLFGIYPAKRAAVLDPIEAMRSE